VEPSRLVIQHQGKSHMQHRWLEKITNAISLPEKVQLPRISQSYNTNWFLPMEMGKKKKRGQVGNQVCDGSQSHEKRKKRGNKGGPGTPTIREKLPVPNVSIESKRGKEEEKKWVGVKSATTMCSHGIKKRTSMQLSEGIQSIHSSSNRGKKEGARYIYH